MDFSGKRREAGRPVRRLLKCHCNGDNILYKNGSYSNGKKHSRRITEEEAAHIASG